MDKKHLNFWKISTVSLTVVLILFLIYLTFNSCLVKGIFSKETQTKTFVEVASAQEVYPLFDCPCCSSSIDECSCPMSKERKTYIDGLTDAKLGEEEVILSYVKRYGLSSFIDENKREEFREKLVREAPAERPIITLTPDSFDFGNVSQAGGTVTTLFEIKNQGQSDLIIDKLETSCGCTSASIIFQGKEGPRFTMSGRTNKNAEDWRITISAGKTAQLKVYYDPNFHQDFRGEAIRTISVFSNDPVDFEKSVQIELNQVQ